MRPLVDTIKAMQLDINAFMLSYMHPEIILNIKSRWGNLMLKEHIEEILRQQAP